MVGYTERTMLLVESDPLAGPAVRRQLGQRLRVAVVGSAQAAFEAVRTHEFTAVLIAGAMDERDGLELAARLKMERPRLLVALIAGELDAESMVTASALGIQIADRGDLPVLADLFASLAAV
jgi:DNA-binding NtrC family response regulator